MEAVGLLCLRGRVRIVLVVMAVVILSRVEFSSWGATIRGDGACMTLGC
jgi:hypothetical protein